MKQDYKYPEIKQDKIENQEMRTHKCSDKSQKHKGKGNVSEMWKLTEIQQQNPSLPQPLNH